MAAIKCRMMLQPGGAVEPETSALMSLLPWTPAPVPELRRDPDLGATNKGGHDPLVEVSARLGWGWQCLFSSSAKKPAYEEVALASTYSKLSALIHLRQERQSASFGESFRSLVLHIAHETAIGPWQANTSGASSDARGAVCATPGINCTLQTATNLAALNWRALVANSQTKGTFTFTDAKMLAFSKRFYHAAQVP